MEKKVCKKMAWQWKMENGNGKESLQDDDGAQKEIVGM